jgi:hypothetical protein
MSQPQSEYLVFVDESGSPTMGNVDPQYPLFVLAFLIVKKSDYVAHITPAPYWLVGIAARTAQPGFRRGKAEVACEERAGRWMGTKMFSVTPKNKRP